MKLLLNSKKRFWLLLALSPFVWEIVLNFSHFVSEWLNVFNYVLAQLTSLFALYNLRFVLELRSGFLIDRLLFNKVTLFLNSFLEFLPFISPRFYFYEGAVQLKGAFVEYVPLVLLPLFFVGVINLFKLSNFKPFILLFVFLILGFLTGQKNIIFLFPVAIIYIYISNLGIEAIDKKYIKIFWIIYFLYIMFLVSRALILNV